MAKKPAGGWAKHNRQVQKDLVSKYGAQKGSELYRLGGEITSAGQALLNPTDTTKTVTTPPNSITGLMEDPGFKLPEPEKKPIAADTKDWDYKTAKVDLKGNPLKTKEIFGKPLTPQGFKPNGQAYFGPGISGWLKEFAYKIKSDEVTGEETKTKWDAFWATAEQNKGKSRMEMEASADTKKATTQFMSAMVSGAKQGKIQVGGTTISSPISPILKFTTVALGAAMDAFQAASELPEKGLGANKAMRQYATERGSYLPDLDFEDEDIMPVSISVTEGMSRNETIAAAKSGQLSNATKKIELRSEYVNSVSRLFAAPLQLYDQVRFWTAPGTFKEKQEAIKKGYTEGRILYTELIHPTVEAEYKRRVAAGEDGQLVGMELADPWAELAGQVIFDPLNLVGAFGKAQKFGSTAAEAAKAVEKSGPIADTKFLDILEDTKNASTSAQGSLKLEEMVDYIQDYNKTLDVRQSYKGTALSSVGNQMSHHKQINNVINNVMLTIRNTGGSADDVADYVVALSKRASNDRQLVKEGIAALNKSPHAALSWNRASMETGYIINSVLGDGDSLIRAVEKTSGNWDEMRKLLDTRVKTALEFIYPSVDEMADASKLVTPQQIKLSEEFADKLQALQDQLKLSQTQGAKQGIKNIQKQISELKAAQQTMPDNKTLKWAKQYEELKVKNPGVVAWQPVQRVLKKFISPINGTLANTYFSLNYGYAFRNGLQNFFTLAVDEGFDFKKGLFPKTAKLDEAIIKRVGEIPISMRGKTFTEAMAGDTLAKAFFSKLNVMKFSPAALSDWAETYTGKLIYLKYFDQTMNDAMTLGKGLPDIAQWEAKGFTKVQADDFKNILAAEGWDGKAAVNKFNAKYGSGSFDKWRTLDFVNPDAQKGLAEYENMWGDIVKAVTDAPVDAQQSDIMKVIEDLKYRVKKNAMKAVDETPRMDDANPAAREMMDARKIAGDKVYTPAMQNEEIFLHNSAQDAVNKMQVALGDAAKKLNKEAMDEMAQGAAESAQKKNELSARIIDYLNGSKNHELYKSVDNEVTELRTWAGEQKRNKYRNWDTAILGPQPANVSYDTVSQAVWKHYQDTKMQKWEDYYAKILQTSGDLAREVGVPEQFVQADKAIFELNQYRNMIFTDQGAFLKPSKLTPALLGTTGNGNNVATLANDYGIATKTNVQGAKLDQQVLNIINKYIRDTVGEAPKIKGAKMNKGQNALKYIAEQGGIDPKEFSDIMGGKIGVDLKGVRPGLFAEGSKNGLDYVAERLVTAGFMNADEATDLNKVRDFIRTYATPTTANDAMANQLQMEKLLETGYSNLNDVPLETAEAAFKKHTGRTDGNLAGRVGETPDIDKEGLDKINAANYPTKLPIAKAKNLSPEQQVVEETFAKQVGNNLQKSVKDYWAARTPPEQNVLNVDFARELSPEYMANKAGNAAAVQKPSSALIREIAREKLAEPITSRNPLTNRVVFMAGGPGSGKGTSLKVTGVDTTDAHFVWDMTMSEAKDLKYIDDAIKAGRPVDIIHIVRNPLDALKGLITRAAEEGRTVPLEVWAEAHSGTPNVIREAIKKYKVNDLVNINIIDNTGDFKSAKEVSLDFMNDRAYNKDDLIRQGKELLEKGHNDGSISDEIYNGIVGDATRRTGEVPGVAAREGIQEGGRGVAQGAGRQVGSADGGGTQGADLQDVTRPYYDDAGNLVKPDVKGLLKAPPPRDPITTPSPAEMSAEVSQGALDALNHVADGIKKNWGLRGTTEGKDATTLITGLEDRIAVARARSMQVAEQYRDFALLPYGETKNMDTMLSMIYPYQFWYSRSYSNWAKRALTTNPEVISRYANLKDTMADQNKELPEWWKYNVKMGDPDNPMYFNLEATVWPLYGITGTDFVDPDKRTNWFTATIDDAGKFGPSVWAPLQWGIAAYYALNGEKDIAAKWGSRAFSQTSTIKAISSYFGTPIELDPNVMIFSGEGGLDQRIHAADPYEEGRISRALSAMEAENKYTKEELMEAARTHTGDAWNEAYIRATQQRAPGQLMSSLFGVGLKPRNKQDIEIDNFYAEYGKYRNLHDADMISDEQYKQSFNELRTKYPFMDIILLSRRAGMGRESAYAYNVISRIPPGMTKEIYEIVGVDPETAQKFYDSGGKLEGMSKTEQDRFMTAMVDAGTMLAIPNNATKQEWTDAKNMYGSMTKQLERQYGADIQDKIGLYSGMDDKKAARMYIDAHPEVSAALDAQTTYISNNSRLMKYYGGIDTLNRYYTSKMYDGLEKKYGNDITNIEAGYFEIYDSKAKKAYLREHPELKPYWDEKDELKNIKIRMLVEFGDKLPESKATLTNVTPENPTQKDLQGFVQGESERTAQDWQASLGQPIMELIADYWYNDKKMQKAVKDNLDYVSENYGYENGDDLLQAILMSLPQQ